MQKSVVYPGTFDPVTYGHIDLVERAARIFDHVIIAIAAGHHKTPFFSVDERVEMVKEIFEKNSKIEVFGFSSLLLHFMQEHQCRIILRGLRVVSDFDYEFQLAGMNRQLDPEIESLFLMPAENYTYVSSSFVREIAQLGGDVKRFVPQNVAARLAARLKNVSGDIWH